MNVEIKKRYDVLVDHVASLPQDTAELARTELERRLRGMFQPGDELVYRGRLFYSVEAVMAEVRASRNQWE